MNRAEEFEKLWPNCAVLMCAANQIVYMPPGCQEPPPIQDCQTQAEALWELVCDRILDIPNSSYLQVEDGEAVRLIDQFLKGGGVE